MKAHYFSIMMTNGEGNGFLLLAAVSMNFRITHYYLLTEKWNGATAAFYFYEENMQRPHRLNILYVLYASASNLIDLLSGSPTKQYFKFSPNNTRLICRRRVESLSLLGVIYIDYKSIDSGLWGKNALPFTSWGLYFQLTHQSPVTRHTQTNLPK